MQLAIVNRSRKIIVLKIYTYADSSNRLLSAISEGEQDGLRTRTLEYDAVGNIINDSAVAINKALTFGHNNRLEQVKVSGGELILADYEYNAKGQRVIKQVNGKIIHFHYDTDDRLLAETTETGLPIREYIYAANQRIAMVDYQRNTAGDIYFMVNDHLDTPQLLLDAQQQIVWSVNQSPFGEVTITGDIEQPLRFPGQYADAETGYSYNYFRDYDPTLGRYIESDPIGLEAGVNTFRYGSGNPLLRFDPRGTDDFNYLAEGWYENPYGSWANRYPIEHQAFTSFVASYNNPNVQYSWRTHIFAASELVKDFQSFYPKWMQANLLGNSSGHFEKGILDTYASSSRIGAFWDIWGWKSATESAYDSGLLWREKMQNPLLKPRYVNDELIDRLFGHDAKLLQCPIN